MSVSMVEWTLALDVGGTKLAAGLVDRDGRISFRHEMPTQAGDGGAAVMIRLVALAKQAMQAAGLFPEPAERCWRGERGRVLAAGLGTGGQVQPGTGAIAFANENIPGWTGIPVRDRLQTGLGLSVVVDNDANCAALAEGVWGAGAGFPAVLCVTVGTGIGGGLVIDGKPYRGASGGALEVGHILVDYRGYPCVCGLRGCLEMYASGPAVLAELFRRHDPDAVSQILGVEAGVATTRDVVAAARHGRSEAIEVMEWAASFLGIGLASMSHILDPSIIVIGGGMSEAWDQIEESMKRAFCTRAMPPARRLPIVRAHLGADAVLAGAGRLAWQLG